MKNIAKIFSAFFLTYGVLFAYVEGISFAALLMIEPLFSDILLTVYSSGIFFAYGMLLFYWFKRNRITRILLLIPSWLFCMYLFLPISFL